MGTSIAQRQVQLDDTGALDRAWYLDTFRDVARLGLDPSEHYLRYGHAMNRNPGPRHPVAFTRSVYGIPRGEEPYTYLRNRELQGQAVAVRHERVLVAAHALFRQGQPQLAIELARQHLPPGLQYCVACLQANLALREGDRAEWLVQMNRYLAALASDPIALEGGGTLFDGLAGAPPVEAVEGPMISVLMPAWNSEATLSKAAGSILGQSWRNLELLIVDDASTDGTRAVMERLAQSDSRVRVLHNATNFGPYVSKNIALDAARGEWVTGQDADDWSHPRRLERQMATARRERLDVTLGYMLRLKADGRISVFDTINHFCLDGAARKSSISALFRRAVLTERLGYWDMVRFGADSEMIRRAEIALGKRFGVSPHVLMLCLDHEASLTNHPDFGVRPGVSQSPARRGYQQSWTQWLNDPANHGALYLPFPQRDRRYAAAPEMVVRGLPGAMA